MEVSEMRLELVNMKFWVCDGLFWAKIINSIIWQQM